MKKHYLLEVGDTTQPGDEYFTGGVWNRATCSGYELGVANSPHRRAIPDATPTPDIGYVEKVDTYSAPGIRIDIAKGVDAAGFLGAVAVMLENRKDTDPV